MAYLPFEVHPSLVLYDLFLEMVARMKMEGGQDLVDALSPCNSNTIGVDLKLSHPQDQPNKNNIPEAGGTYLPPVA